MLGKYIALWDTYDIEFTNILYLKDSFESGIFPYWNPFILAGEAFLSQAARFIYGPSNLLIAYFSNGNSVYYNMMIALYLYSLVGAIALYYYLRNKNIDNNINILLCVSYSCFAYTTYFGQYSLSIGMALLPVNIYFFDKLLCAKNKALNIFLFSFVYSWTFLETYFGIFLFNSIFLLCIFLYEIYQSKDRKHHFTSNLIILSVSALAFILVTSVYWIPVLEGRMFFYGDLFGDLVSIDPRVRGMTTTPGEYVPLLSSYKNFGSLINTHFSKLGSPEWANGFPVSLTFLCIIFYKGIFKRTSLMLLSASLLLWILYSLGPKLIVYHIASYVPLLGNIRYPLIAYYLIYFHVILIFGILCRDYFRAKAFESSNTLLLIFSLVFIISAPVASAVLFSLYLILFLYKRKYIKSRSTLLLISLVSIIELIQVNPIKEMKVDTSIFLRDRATNVRSNSSERQYFVNGLLEYSDKDWLNNKISYNHGYSPSDSPRYPYIKNHKFLEKKFYVLGNVIEFNEESRANYKSDNEYLADNMSKIPENVVDGVLVQDYRAINFNKRNCNVKSFEYEPNKFTFSFENIGECFLFLTNKYYPGWELSVDGKKRDIIKANILFMGTYLNEENENVSFEFKPTYLRTAITMFCVGIFIFIATLLKGVIYEIQNRDN